MSERTHMSEHASADGLVQPWSTVGRVIAAGLVAGMVDALYFTVLSVVQGRTPIKALQSIAGFWLGSSSGSLGIKSALLGLLTHFALATIMAGGYLLFRVVHRRTSMHPILSGALYGALLYLIMYQIVLPLRWPAIFPRFDRWVSIADIGIHLLVGISIALTFARGDRAEREGV